MRQRVSHPRRQGRPARAASGQLKISGARIVSWSVPLSSTDLHLQTLDAFAPFHLPALPRIVPEADMLQYQIYELNGQNLIRKRYDLVAPDDVAALENAKQIARAATFEVWKSARFVARAGKDGEALP